MPPTKSKVKKVVLAYSGGLDTSVIVPWLRNNYGCEVICFCANLGQEEELSGLEAKAIASGASKCYIEDLRLEFITDYIFPTMQAGAVYERKYLLGTSMARPLIAKRLVEIAELEGADAIAHGATGKGNDQVRFELTVMALNPAAAHHRPLARMGDPQPQGRPGLRRRVQRAGDSHGKIDLQPRPQPFPHEPRGRPAGRSLERTRRGDVHPHHCSR